MSNNPRQQPVIIIGGGPSGYATALYLASHQWTNVTLIERATDPTKIDPTRQFSYLISWRGLTLINQFPTLLQRLQEEGISIVPPKMTLLAPDAEPMEKTFDTGDNEVSYWIRRANLIGMMADVLEKEYKGVVNVMLGTTCRDIVFKKNESDKADSVEVIVENKAESKQSVPAKLLIGCDGVNSIVRKALADDERSSKPKVVSPKGFELDVWTSPAAGLCYKSFVLPARPILMTKPIVEAAPERMYVLRYDAKGKSSNEYFSMGLLPVGKDVSQGRTGTIVRKASHQIWKLKSIEEGFKFFETNFPHINVKDLISEGEMKLFIDSGPSKFPVIQKSKSLYGLLNSGSSGVVLLGDAAHCFPPDLGQGVNSALEDVKILVDELNDLTTNDSVGVALVSYSQKRDEDIAALMRLMKIGFPYQYGQKQSGLILWALNQTLRKYLNKVAPSLFSPQIFSMTSSRIRYKDILERARITTTNIWLLIVTIVLVPFSAYLLTQS